MFLASNAVPNAAPHGVSRGGSTTASRGRSVGENGNGARGGRSGARRGERVARDPNDSRGTYVPPTPEERYDKIKTRPASLQGSKEGNTGTAMNNLLSNYFPVRTTTKWCIFNYTVSFQPDDDLQTYEKKRLLRNLRDEAQELGFFIFDGSNMYTVQRLPQVFTYLLARSHSCLVFLYRTCYFLSLTGFFIIN